MSRWLEEETELLQLLRDQGYTYAEIGSKLGRTENSVRRKAQNCNISKTVKWTIEEDRILEEVYPEGGASKVASILNRSKTSIKSRAYIKNISYNNTLLWTEQDVAYLTKNYGILGAQTVGEVLGRTEGAIQNKAYSLGLGGAEKTLGYSKISIRWLTSLNNPNILHAENGGEQRVAGYRVDGYDPVTNSVYEFHGDVFHGNLDIFNPEDQPNPFDRDTTAEELWQKTFDRMLKISEVATVFYIWEKDFKEGKNYEKF